MDGFSFQELVEGFSVLDVLLILMLSFGLSAFIGWIYQITHSGGSYTQSFVFMLVLSGMVIAVVMLIIGSNVARAFSLVGALCVIRFRTAVKEARDIAFIFFTMAIAMAVGTRFYLLAAVATVAISLIVVVMTRFNWYASKTTSQILRVQVPDGFAFDVLFDTTFLKYTQSSELISVESLRGGTLTELTYKVGLKNSNQISSFLAEVRDLVGDNEVSLIAGYDGADL